MDKRFFCFGLGYSAQALADRLAAEGWEIAGTVRSGEKRDALAKKGWAVTALEEPGADKAVAAALQGATHILSSVPPSPQHESGGDPVIERFGAAMRAAGSVTWIGYLSTTGVYGDRGGAWVDEDSALEPTGARGAARVAAESAWSALGEAIGAPVFLFRLAGIYGPGRNALETVKRGQARRIDKPGQVFSRIHQDDITNIVYQAMQRPDRPGAYNCCDDNPAPPEEVIAYACTLLGVDPPPLIPFDQADLSPMARSFYRDNKRCDNRRIKEDLGVVLRWPDYKTALKAML